MEPGQKRSPAEETPSSRGRTSTAPAKALQLELKSRLVLRPPAGFAPATVGGADLSMRRFGRIGYGGIVVLEREGLGVMASATATVPLTFPYVPGYLSFRELPVLEVAWEALEVRPEVLIFDGHGTAHPRRFGLACHGGMIFDTPSIGCAKSLLVGEHGALAPERGATSDIVLEGEVVGRAVRTRSGVAPVYVSPGHLMDLDTAVEIVLSVSRRYREPETTRAAHRLVNEARRAAGE
jgi:deoxyribonuclease V